MNAKPCGEVIGPAPIWHTCHIQGAGIKVVIKFVTRVTVVGDIVVEVDHSPILMIPVLQVGVRCWGWGICTANA